MKNNTRFSICLLFFVDEYEFLPGSRDILAGNILHHRIEQPHGERNI